MIWLPITLTIDEACLFRDGRKSQIRRPVAAQPSPYAWPMHLQGNQWLWSVDGRAFICPYGAAGDGLLGCERWGTRDDQVFYAADTPTSPPPRVVFQSPDLMPRRLCRICRPITHIACEKLSAIVGCARDLAAEGYDTVSDFAAAWDSAPHRTGESFKDNPWVWAITSGPEDGPNAECHDGNGSIDHERNAL